MSQQMFDVMLEASGRAVLVGGFIALALAAFRVKAPAIRHAAWTAVVVAMMALPLMAGWLPAIEVPLSWPQASSLARLETAPEPTTAATDLSAPGQTGAPAAASVSIPSRSTARLSVLRSGGLNDVPQPGPPGAVLPAWQSQDWRATAVFVWMIVAGVLLLREAIGWRMAHRLAQEGVPTGTGDGTYHSERIATPVVTGVLQPRVMVPSSWPAWGSGVRGMVLEHERAHVHRRDPLVAALARVNRSIFWFHPMAWWMERHLSRLAERACDEVAMRAVQDTRLYAALLVEMAHRLQQHGQRVAWQGIGIVSSRRFEDRLDQILQGPAPAMSLRAKGALGISCGVLIVAAIACGTAAAPLAEDPELAKELAKRAAAFDDYEAAIAMTLDQVAELERVVVANPDDLSATSRLLTFYLSKGQKLMGWSQMVAARRAVLLRTIERHPESSLVTWRLPRRLDPEGYEKARALWLTHLGRKDASPAVLSQAATFFERVEKPLAEEILLRAQAIDPKGQTLYGYDGTTVRLAWSRRLGVLYAMAIVGSHDQTAYDDVTSADAEQMKSAFARAARQKLDQSQDTSMLLGAGSFLINAAAKAKVNFDPTALGREYVTRALTLDPSSVEAKRLVQEPAFNFEAFMKERTVRIEQMRQRFGKTVDELDDAAFDQLPAATKLEYAPVLLWSPYNQAAASYRTGNEKASEAAFLSLKKRADSFQGLVDQGQATAVPAALQFDLHVAFGTYAMHQGNRREAVRRLGLALSAASTGFGADRLALGSAAEKLTYDLLDAGERESVAAFYDAVAKPFASEWRTTYENAAAAIRAGKMPASYQRSLARLK